MQHKKLLLFFMISVVYSLEATKLSQKYKNILEALKIIKDNLVVKHLRDDFTLLTYEKQKDNEIYDAVKLEIIKYVFRDEAIRFVDIKYRLPTQYMNSIILLQNVSVFPDIKHHLEVIKLKYSGFHLIVLLEGSSSGLQDIFKAFWRNNVNTVYVLMNINDTTLLSFEPFEDPKNCNNMRPKVIHKFFNSSFPTEINLIKKFNNLNTCPIKAASFTAGQACYKEISSNGSTVINGYEMEMMKIVAKLLNFTLDLKFREGTQQWGVIYENGTVTGTLGDLKSEKADIAFGNYYLKAERKEHFTCSLSYLSYPLFLVLSQAEKLTAIEKLMQPFHFNVWIYVFSLFGLGIIFVWIINAKFKFIRPYFCGTKVHSPIFDMFAVTMGLSLTILPKRNSPRFVLMMFMMFCLVIRSLYQGSLYKFLQSDGRHKDPETIKQLIESQYTFFVSDSNLETLRKYNPSMYPRAKAAKSLKIDSLSILPQKSSVFASKLDLIDYSQIHKKFPYVICKEAFHTVNVALYCRKHFFLKNDIDEVIMNIQTSGLLDFWLKEYDKTPKWKENESSPKTLTFEHLSGCFYLLMIGNMCGVVIFILELLYLKLKHRKS